MTTLEGLRREREKLKNEAEAKLEQKQIGLKRKRLRREIKALKKPRRAAFKRGLKVASVKGARIAGRGIVRGTKQGFGFLERVTRPTPAQIAAHKGAMKKRRYLEGGKQD